MALRTDVVSKVQVDGRPYTLVLVENPTIDDVLVVEAKLTAAEIMNEESFGERRVDRAVRDLLIRMGVER